MNLNILLIVASLASTTHAFLPHATAFSRRTTAAQGYLDNYTAELYTPDITPDTEADQRDANVMSTRDKDRFGPGSWEGYVDFDSFDGGDAQMGVVGDGSYNMNDFGTFGEVVQPRSLHAGKNGCWR